MLVLSDTSVLSNLAVIGRLEIIRNQFDVVMIPEAVAEEISRLRDAAASHAIGSALTQGWLQVIQLGEEELSFAQTLKLDLGEAHAIAVAKYRGADLPCIDEQRGRFKALELKIPFKGLLGLLLEEKNAGRLASVSPCLDGLQFKAKFFMAPDLVKHVLMKAGEV
jgi:predicted nucleic acid-binding protein